MICTASVCVLVELFLSQRGGPDRSLQSRGLTHGVASVFGGLGMGLGGPIGGLIADKYALSPFSLLLFLFLTTILQVWLAMGVSHPAPALRVVVRADVDSPQLRDACTCKAV